jgi:hypothetical protein
VGEGEILMVRWMKTHKDGTFELKSALVSKEHLFRHWDKNVLILSNILRGYIKYKMFYKKKGA